MTPLGSVVHHLENSPCSAQHAPSLLSTYHPTGVLLGKTLSTPVYLLAVHSHNAVYHRYLYYQTFGIDACFRFKRRQVSNYEKDPELGPGYAYLVAWDSYSEYLRRFTDQQEVGFISSLVPDHRTDARDE